MVWWKLWTRGRDVAITGMTKTTHEVEEIERCVFAAKPWKAAGEDGLPAIVWRQIWPVVKDRILTLFQTSIATGQIPDQ